MSVVVDEPGTFCTSISPDEADSPLSIHPDAVLTTTIDDQPFRPVPWRDPKVIYILRGLDQLKLPQGCSLHYSFNALGVLLVPDAFGVFTPERADHIIST